MTGDLNEVIVEDQILASEHSNFTFSNKHGDCVGVWREYPYNGMKWEVSSWDCSNHEEHGEYDSLVDAFARAKEVGALDVPEVVTCLAEWAVLDGRSSRGT